MKFSSKEVWERYAKARSFALEYGLMNNFNEIFTRLLTWDSYDEDGEMDSEVVISSDFDEYCFTFHQQQKDGRVSICGGIIFHGLRGELENGSVCLTPSAGWSIHT